MVGIRAMDSIESSIIAALAAARAASQPAPKPTDRHLLAGAEPASAAAAPRLMLLVFEDTYLSWTVALDAVPMSIGRSAECRLRLSDHEVSRQHCTIRLLEGRAVLTDLGST